MSSTLTTVAQNADSPSHGRAGRGPAPLLRRPAAQEVLPRQIEQIPAADELHPGDTHQVDGQQRRDDPEDERAHHAVAERLLLLAARQAENHDRHDQGVVRAEQSFEEDEEPDGNEIAE